MPKKFQHIAKIQVTLEVPFYEYDTGRKNYSAIKSIEKWVSDSLKQSIYCIPLYIERDNSGCVIEHETGKGKITSINTIDKLK